MQIRILNWNVNRRADLRPARELLDSLGWDLCTLQEVRPESAQAAAGGDGLEGSHAGATAALAGVIDGAMVVARAPFRLRGASVVADLPSPDRSLLARVGHDEQRYFGLSVLVFNIILQYLY